MASFSGTCLKPTLMVIAGIYDIVEAGTKGNGSFASEHSHCHKVRKGESLDSQSCSISMPNRITLWR